jgi:hypothetical protein
VCWVAESWNLGAALDFQHYKGVEGRARSPKIRLGRGTIMLLHDPASKNLSPSWLELILHPFGVGTSHGRPWIHLTHHGPDLGEATTFPHIVFSALFRHGHTQVVLCLGTPKV